MCLASQPRAAIIDAKLVSEEGSLGSLPGSNGLLALNPAVHNLKLGWLNSRAGCGQPGAGVASPQPHLFWLPPIPSVSGAGQQAERGELTAGLVITTELQQAPALATRPKGRVVHADGVDGPKQRRIWPTGYISNRSCALFRRSRAFAPSAPVQLPRGELLS